VTAANVFVQQSASALSDPAVGAALLGHSRKKLIIAGFSAKVAVLHAGVDAIEAGYQVYVVADAIGGHSHDGQRIRVVHMPRAIEADAVSRCVIEGITSGRASVPARLVLELGDVSSGDMRLPDHAARSMI
jgi:nicotinamidase-related amidase